jgi:hypothetical protein
MDRISNKILAYIGEFKKISLPKKEKDADGDDDK